MSELKLLEKKEIDDVTINEDEAIKKQLIKKGNYDKYFEIQSLYKKVFDYFLEQSIGIDIDKELAESNLDYGKLKEEQKNIYHKFSYIKSDYLFVRNFFHVERLSENQIKFLNDRIEEKNLKIDDEILEIVKTTYKDIIKKDISDENEAQVFYGVPTPEYMFNNDSLVIFINYGRNNIQYNTDDEFIENKIKKEEYLEELIKKIVEILEKKLECTVEMRYFKGVI